MSTQLPSAEVKDEFAAGATDADELPAVWRAAGYRTPRPVLAMTILNAAASIAWFTWGQPTAAWAPLSMAVLAFFAVRGLASQVEMTGLPVRAALRLTALQRWADRAAMAAALLAALSLMQYLLNDTVGLIRA